MVCSSILNPGHVVGDIVHVAQVELAELAGQHLLAAPTDEVR